MEIDKYLEQFVNDYNYNIGVYVNDLNGNEFKINENMIFEAASCIKLFILIEYYRQIHEGLITREDNLVYTKDDNPKGVANSGVISSLEPELHMSSKNYAILMIIVSDNVATNKLIDYLGIYNINSTIKKLGFNNTKLLGKLNFTDFKGIGYTTPYEYALAYQKVLKGELFSKEISDEILEILKKQKESDMLIKGMPLHDILFKGTDDSKVKYIAAKSGGIAWSTKEIDNVRNDGGIISTIYGEYIVSIFISGFDEMYFHYNNEAINCGSTIHKVIYKEFISNKGSLKKNKNRK